MDDLKDMTDEQLTSLLSAVQRELSKRRAATEALSQIDELIRSVAADLGRDLSGGSAWAQPTSAVDSYPMGSVVTHNGARWVSLAHANTWEPGVAGWREQSTDGSVPEWRQPSSTVDAYMTGDLVTWQGETWRSVMDYNTWSPEGHPDGWELVEVPEPEPEPEPEEPLDPEEPTDPDPEEPVKPAEPEEPESPAAWVQPASTVDAYQLGDTVSHNGQVWVSVHEGANTWEPGVYGWEVSA